MRKFYYLMSLIAVIAIVSCKKKEEVVPLPTVDFSYNPVNPIAPSTVTFTSNCTNATSFSWNFGNGQTSTLPNPSVNYTTGGTFTVILTATGAGGTNGITKTITVTASVVADFTFTPANGRAPLAVTFTNTSQNATSYAWDFGNGQTSTLQNPQTTYSTAGVYTVALTATGTGGTNRITKTVSVDAPVGPVADFSFTPSNGRAPVSIALTNTSQNATSYSWDFGNGQTSTAQTPSVTYTNGGTFTITLTANGQAGQTNRISKTVTILPPYTKVGLSALTILNYPATKTDGSNWDPAINGTFPDVYFDITVTGTSTSLYTLAAANRKEDLRTSDLPSGWAATAGTSFYLHNILTQGIDVDLYDYDSIGSNEYMGTATFNLSNYTTGANPYPATVTITNGSTSIRLSLIWQ
jgi:PKD repeat protein